jgi:hypothetical protein
MTKPIPKKKQEEPRFQITKMTIPKKANEDAPDGIYKYGVDDEEIKDKDHK